MNITEKIQALRNEKQWSVAQLARETNIPTVSLRVMLARKDYNNYSVPSLIKIAKVLDTTVSYLTKNEEENLVPQITKGQKKDLQASILVAIDSYFDQKEPKDKTK